MLLQETIFHLFLLLVGLILLIKGSSFFMQGLSAAAAKSRFAAAAAALESIALFLPASAVSIAAAGKGQDDSVYLDLAAGNIIGSNITVLLLACGLAALILRRAGIRKEVLFSELFFAGMSVVLLILLGAAGRYFPDPLTKIFCIFLLFLCLFFFFWRIKTQPEGSDARRAAFQQPAEAQPLKRMLLFSLIGFFAVFLGGDLVAEEAAAFAVKIGVGVRFTAVTLVAFASVLPVVASSVRSAIARDPDSVLRQITGNVLFQSSFSAALVTLISPPSFRMPAAVSFQDMILLAAAAAVFFLFIYRGKMSWKKGIVLILLYAAYLLICLLYDTDFSIFSV